MLKIYGIKNCDSVKKAIKFAKTHELEYELRDFKTDPVDITFISEWVKKSNIDKLFNTRGTTYRTLKLKELNLDEKGKIEWLVKENMLIKRPVIEYSDNKLLVGFDQALYEKEL